MYIILLFFISTLIASTNIEDAQALYDNKNYLAAKKIIESNSSESESYYYLCYMIYLKLDDLNKANSNLQSAISSSDDDTQYDNEVDFLSELINDLKNSNKTLTSGFVEEAITEITDLTQKYKTNAIVFYRLGYAYAENDDYDNAIIHFRTAVELNPFKEEYKREIKNIANIEISKGKEFYDIKEYQEALIHFNKALEYDPENSGAMFRLGNIYFAIKDYVKASELLERGLTYQGNNYKVLYMLGRCYSALNENDKAIDFYDKALSFNPEYIKAIIEKAKIFKAKGDLDISKELLNEILVYGNSAKAYELLIDIETQSNNIDKAFEIGENAISQNPDSYSLLARMSGLYNEKGNHEKAKSLSKRSLKIKRNYAPAAFELGIAELNMCNKLAAKEAFNIAKRDRNYRKAAGEYLKQENFEYYTKDCN